MTTVREMLRAADVECGNCTLGGGLPFDAILELLGIPADMDVEVLRRRLLWGERVQAWVDYVARFAGDHGIPDGFDYAHELADWLTREA